MEMRGFMGGFYKISEWIMRLAVTNVLWIICSFPFWFVMIGGFWALQSVTEEQVTNSLTQSVILLAIVSPFTFFPATSAMFSVARKWVLGDADVPLFKTFFRNYKQNFVQAMLGGIIYSVLLAVLVIDYKVYLSSMSGFSVIAYLFIALLILLVISLHHFFSLLSHFHMKTFQLLKNAVVLTIGKPIRSLIMTVGTAAIIMISYRFNFLIPFFFGSIIAIFTFFNFNIVIQKMTIAKEADSSEQDEEPEIPEDQRETKK